MKVLFKWNQVQSVQFKFQTLGGTGWNFCSLSEPKGFQGGCKSCCLSLIDSEMAGPILVKLSGIVKCGRENVLAKEFCEKISK